MMVVVNWPVLCRDIKCLWIRKPKGLPEVFRHNIDSLALCLSRLYRDKSAAGYRHDLTMARRKGLRYYPVSKKRINIVELKKLKQFPIFRLGTNKGGLIVESTIHEKCLLDHWLLVPLASLPLNAIRWVSALLAELVLNWLLTIFFKVPMAWAIKPKWAVCGCTMYRCRQLMDLDVVSTLNIEIQDVAENALREQLNRHNARFGVAVVMEVETGAVKAMVNLHRAAPGVYVEDHFNYAVGQSTEPGSTFKLASLMVALEDGVVDVMILLIPKTER
jgi:cell division protein FtsI (penicillin-binding protein 3)